MAIEYSTTEFGQQLKINSMKNLISMVAFLPEHPYSKFLSQPLEKWMFVPCDKDGNFLKEPKTWRHYTSSDQAFRSLHNEALKLCAEYGQAKSRCLFEGFEYNQMGFVYLNEKGCALDEEYMETNTIESLVKYNIQLTETAKKQIGL